ncbi:pyruvate formate-lyase-activating protein [Cryobacterium sp. PH31-AA6]|uniref:pyruvate formate-lyase-activating protein n=1 Tax=Cryobacterium sp. PH31-AA6 TaxID=3046205 RepID=UPI0024B985BC|nr:pyruvate formate-lyase-activating protein [Cryobacterium sp. PH31-AA6]MDJ0325432.1 pyruvate formate-lyase-activating protein [Cryobacterium sp. PH31-AA6]
MPAVNLGLPSAGAAIDLVDGSSVSSEQAELAELHHLEMEAIHNGTVASVHSWELVTAVDGPGTRMTLFLSGCLLRCQYCHNPDTWKMRDGLLTTLDDLVTRVKRYKGVFESTGGGITISGGEPLMQPAFVARIFEECHKLGVHTTLDTSGFLGKSASDKLLDNLDLVLLDVKSGIPGTYKEVTGRDLAPTVAFGDRLAERKIPVWVRFVLVPGLTDAVDNVDAVAEIVARWPNVERVEVLPFHQMGEDKWDKLNLPYPLHGVHPPDNELQERVREQFRARGLTVF